LDPACPEHLSVCSLTILPYQFWFFEKKSQNQITTRPNAFKIIKEFAIFMKELVVLRPVI
jgi:hypothetical protein